jgi:hypothetical protein
MPHLSVRTVLLCAIAALMLAPSAPAAERPDGPRQPMGRPNQKFLEPGQEAPDLTLPRLSVDTDKDGNPAGKVSDQKVTVSSFRGKKPVVLILSSYT